MKRVRMTMAQALVKFMDNQYIEIDGKEIKFVEGVWGIFGHGCVVGMGEALEQDTHHLKFYQGHNEQGMAHVAIGYAKQHRRQKIMAAMSSIGPGATNMVTAAATATVNRIPFLVLPGDIFACRQPDPVLQQLEQPHDLSISVNDAFKPVCKYWDRISRPEQLISAAMNAFRVLTDPAETGAVCISIPQDVQGEAYDYPVEFLEKRVHRIKRTPIEDADLEEILEKVKNKKKPLIISGGGVAYSMAEDALVKLVEKFQIPVAETQAGKGYLPYNHPLNLGTLGVTGSLSANRAAKDADLIIGIGTRFNDFTTASKSVFENSEAEFVTINLNSFDAYKMMGLPIVADAKVAIEILHESLEKINFQTNFSEKTSKDLAEWNQEVDRLYAMKSNSSDRYSQTRVIGQLNEELLPEDAIIVGASGSLPGDLGRLWRTKSVGGYNMEYGFSCMGYEVAATLGVKLAQPEREVYCMVGDGSYLLLHSELYTSIQEGIKINIILLDNNGFQCIDNLQVGQGIPSFGCQFKFRNSETGRLDGDYIPVDFAGNARSYGCQAWTVTNEDQLVTAFQEARKSPVSTLIDIKVDRKSMSDGYDSWWRVGIPEISKNTGTNEAYKNLQKKISTLRDF